MIGSSLSIRLTRWLIRDQRVYPYAIAVIAGGLVGARIAHVIDNWSSYESDVLRVATFAGGGIGTMGAPIGSTIAGFIACKRLRLPVGFMFDVTATGIALGEAIGRLGDIVNGEHHGTACTPPFGVCVGYTSPLTLGQPGPVHFIGLYDALLMLLTFVVLFAFWRRVRGRPPEARVYCAYLFLLGAGRFLESFVRDDPVVFLGLQEAHWLGLAYALVGGTMLVLLTLRTRSDGSGPKPLHKAVSAR